jgi:hypothetical protein
MRLRVYAVTSVLFILIATTLIPALAQDTPTPEPPIVTETATLTLTPTEPPTLTLAPTDAPIPTSTETGTPTATEAATLEGTPSETPTASGTIDGTLTETATASASPTGTETATEMATATLLPPEPGLELIYDERFDGGAYPFDMLLNSRGRLTRLGGEIALSIRQNDAPVTVTPFFLADVVLQARFALNSGAVVLETRATDLGGYRAVIGLGGQVQLFRNGVLLATGSAPAASAGQWRTLRLSTIGDVLRVSVDGIEVLTATDSDPLLTGNMRFSGSGMNVSGLLIDDIAVFVRIPDEATKADTTNARLAAQNYYTFPRGDQMIFVNSGLSAFSANGSQQVSANASEPFISADGRQLMTACGTYQVCVSDAEGDNEQFLAVHPDHVSNFNYPGGFSPSGLWALYLTQTDLTDELWAVNLRSGALRQVYSQDIMMFYPLDDWHWGRDGNVYFARFEDGIFQISSPTNGAPSVDLVVSQTDNFGTIQTNSGCEDSGLDDIAVNADGEIAFTQICADSVGGCSPSGDDCGDSGEILVVKRQGYQIILVITTEAIGRIAGVQWVPDGTNELIAVSQSNAFLFSGNFYSIQIVDSDENAVNQTYLSLNTPTIGSGRIAWGLDRATTSFFAPDCSTLNGQVVFVGEAPNTGTANAQELYDASNGQCTR